MPEVEYVRCRWTRDANEKEDENDHEPSYSFKPSNSTHTVGKYHQAGSTSRFVNHGTL